MAPPNIHERFCIVESSLACEREDWVRVAPDVWEAFLPDGTYRTYKFVRREQGFLSNGTVVECNQALVYIPDKGEEATLRVMTSGEWVNYGDHIRVPGQIETAYQDGEVLLAKKRPEQAVDQFNSCIEQDPRFTAAYIMRANAYYQSGQMDKVIADCNKANDLVPNCKVVQELLKKAEAFKTNGTKKQKVSYRG